MRVCFRSTVDPRFLNEYRRRHGQVWPEMLFALKVQAGITTPCTLATMDSLLASLNAKALTPSGHAWHCMALTEVNAYWQKEMAALFPASESAPDSGFMVMEEVLNLDQQLADAGTTSEGPMK